MRQKKTVKRRRTPLPTDEIALKNEASREVSRAKERLRLDAAIEESTTDIARRDALATNALSSYTAKRGQQATRDELSSLWTEVSTTQNLLTLARKRHQLMSEKRKALEANRPTAAQDNKSSESARDAIMTNRERSIRTMNFRT